MVRLNIDYSYIKKIVSSNFPKLLKFGSVGGITTIFALVSYYILLSILNLPIYPVYVSVYFFGILISYLLNSKFTFERSYNRKDSISYYFIYGIGLLFGLAIIYFLKNLNYVFDDIIIVVITIVPRFVLTFTLLRIFIYKD